MYRCQLSVVSCQLRRLRRREHRPGVTSERQRTTNYKPLTISDWQHSRFSWSCEPRPAYPRRAIMIAVFPDSHRSRARSQVTPAEPSTLN